jgi:hypothetical protein
MLTSLWLSGSQIEDIAYGDDDRYSKYSKQLKDHSMSAAARTYSANAPQHRKTAA